MTRKSLVIGPYKLFAGEMDDAIAICRNSSDGTPEVTLEEVEGLLRKAGVA